MFFVNFGIVFTCFLVATSTRVMYCVCFYRRVFVEYFTCHFEYLPVDDCNAHTAAAAAEFIWPCVD